MKIPLKAKGSKVKKEKPSLVPVKSEASHQQRVSFNPQPSSDHPELINVHLDLKMRDEKANSNIEPITE